MADDEWQTVPERPRPTRGRNHRGRGGYRGRSAHTAGSSTSQAAASAGDAGKQGGNEWRSSSHNKPAADAYNRSRSRPRAVPSASNNASSFKLETSNMFALHVGKSSRARKNEELKEFFESRDDDEGEEETFDGIDDDDLDISDYESEDDADEATSFPPVPILIRCPLCPGHEEAGENVEANKNSQNGDEEQEQEQEQQQGVNPRPLLTSAVDLTKHLREKHQLVFKNLNHMVLILQKYLDVWAAKLDSADVADIATKEETDDGTVVYHIDAASCPEDKEIRDAVQKENLDDILRVQDIERHGDALEPRKCLFCKHVCEDRADLFRHGYREHNFNIGLPDNLVNVNEFLHILESKLAALQCLYCEKTFTSPAVLRKHMRKKKHFKISARNRLYDRFYVVNYIELGKSWEAIENEKADSDAEEADRKDDSWADWDDKADLPAKSLFDEHVAATPEECWGYLKSEYGFDIHKIREDRGLDFYKTVALINIVRRSTSNNACFACAQSFEDGKALSAHLKQAGPEHLQPPASDSPAWDDKENLIPAIENDPLLMDFDDDGDFDEEDEEKSRKLLEESKKILRKKFDQISLESPKKASSTESATAAAAAAAVSS
ncbi:hypothetical protein GGI12_002984 [Dipsacomyces acuminosporus]|nr:hypothetical protein GGI12_002984 [Dipsacomyces acuminosporus]